MASKRPQKPAKRQPIVDPELMDSALRVALRRIRSDRRITESASSCALITTPGRDSGIQVFVQVCRFSKKLLKEKPETGGLLSRKP